MKISFPIRFIVPLLTLFPFGTACNGPVKKSPATDLQHPKLIKTIGDPRHGNVECIIQDKTGTLWFGTTENGLYRYDGTSFKRYLAGDGLGSNHVSALLEDKEGIIWIGTGAGLCRYNGTGFEQIKIPVPAYLPPNNNPVYKNTHWVYNIRQATNGSLWLATIDGMYVYAPQARASGQSAFAHFKMSKSLTGFLTGVDYAERILEDTKGNIWFGGRTISGAYRYNGKSVTNFKLDKVFQNGPVPKPHNWAWPQVQDKKGNIWFSNWGGVYRYDGKSFKSFTQKDGLPHTVTRIIEDRKGNIWFGGRGLARYDGSSFRLFTKEDGLTSPWVWSLLEDKNGNLWVGTVGTNLFLFDGETFIAYSEYKQKPTARQSIPSQQKVH